MVYTHPLTHSDTLTLSKKDGDSLILGGLTAEGGDISLYRNTSGDKQLYVNGDAANNEIALSLFGGAVFQNYLTVGQTTLSTLGPFVCIGNGFISGVVKTTGLLSYSNNTSSFVAGNINITSPNATNHTVSLQIDSSDIIAIQATGNGAGDIVDKAIGLYGITPTVQASAIGDPAESIAGNNTAIDSILAALRTIGLIAT